VPVHPDSAMGIFRQLISISATGRPEFELSTYSSHLKNMKYFMENANGKNAFLFTTKAGQRQRPQSGGPLPRSSWKSWCAKLFPRHRDDPYLNLKVMANKTPGIITGPWLRRSDLQPLYLTSGQARQFYTFSIAEASAGAKTDPAGEDPGR